MKIAHFAVYKDNDNVSICFLQQRSKGDTKNAKNNEKQEMKESKAVYVTKNKIKYDQNLVYQLYNTEQDKSPQKWERTSNFGSQYDSRRDQEICTCKNVVAHRKQQEIRYFSGLPKQIYAYRSSKSLVDIGVGSVKALQRRKVRRVYLPETDEAGVGSSELSFYVFPRRHPKIAPQSSYYGHKRTSSKCVGGILEYNTRCAISEKLSPITNTKSGATSPETIVELINTEIGSNTVEKLMETMGTQVEIENKPETQDHHIKAVEPIPSVVESKPAKKVSEQTQKFKYPEEKTEEKKKPEVEKKIKEHDKTYSSDSLVQHVHNLENPSDEKHSRTSFPDPMENKLEREYRKMFSTTKSKDSKPSYDFKSASILKRRFEALRRGVRKEDSNQKKNDSMLMNTSKQETVLTHKDASVTSDPPSLIGRSFSNTKKYSPEVKGVEHEKHKSSHYKKEECSTLWQQNVTESECQGVKGMFKLWGKKFNFEESASGKRQATPMPSYNTVNKSEKEVKTKVETTAKKKEGKKFFFFKKRSKEKTKEVYKSKKDVTAGRCEIGDGLVLKIGGTVTPKKVAKIPEESNDITRKAWLKRFLSTTIESARSVNVRWNNNMYATSSSTVFELFDSVYNNTGFVFKSRSEILTDESSFFRSYTKHKVNFVQDIEAWMIPQTIHNIAFKQIPLRINSDKEIKKKNMEFTGSDQKWLIEKSEAFAHKIEVVLQPNNLLKKIEKKISSEYLKIDIPKGFFDTTSSDESKRNQSSDEEVYKIVEYETNSEIGRGRKALNDLRKGYQASNDIQVIVSLQDGDNSKSRVLETVIKKPPTYRDEMIQCSNVNEPKRCDVIGVGIITQRDLREIRKPILKIQEDLTDEDSEPAPQLIHKKCEFAESYLQEFCQDWTPLGIDMFSWCISDSHLRSCSEKSDSSYHNQGDGSKSCPNIYEDFQAATFVGSSETSSICSNCPNKEPCYKIEKFKDKFFKKFKIAAKAKRNAKMTPKRVLPKDSVEVFKRRKIYAASAKSQWTPNCDCADKPVSVPSIESKGCLVPKTSTSIECPKIEKPVVVKPYQKPCKKHVSMPDCETMNNEISKQLTVKKEGILQFKGANCDAKKKLCTTTPKHAVVNPVPSCEIPQPPCRESCENMRSPPCNKPHSPSCNDFPQTSSGSSVCSKPQLPPSCGPPVTPRCFPTQSPCSPPPCPASLRACKNKSPQRSGSDTSQKCPSPCTPPPCAPQQPPCKMPPQTSSSETSQDCSFPCKPPPCLPEPPCKKSPPPCSPDPSHNCCYPCPPPPCPVQLPPCKKSPKACSPQSSHNFCSYCNDTYCSKIETPACIKPPSPPCKYHQSSLSCSTQSILPGKITKSPCSPPPCPTEQPPCKKSPPPCSPNLSQKPHRLKVETPSCEKISTPPCKKPKSSCPTPPPCKNLSFSPCAEPSRPICNKSPPCSPKLAGERSKCPSCTKPSTPSPCKKQSTPPRCTDNYATPPCKKPSLLSSILPWKKSNSSCQKASSPVKTICPSTPTACPIPPMPCKMSVFLPAPCTKLLNPLKSPPCKNNPSQCCHNVSSCHLSCQESKTEISKMSCNDKSPPKKCKKRKSGKCKCCETPSTSSYQVSLKQPPSETAKCVKSSCPSPKKIRSTRAIPKKDSCPREPPSCVPLKKVQSSCPSMKIQSPCGSPQNSQPESKTGLSLNLCPSPPQPLKRKEKSPCRLPPCDKFRKSSLVGQPRCEQKMSQEYPCPKNNQICNQPSNTSPPAVPKRSSLCHKNCSMMPAETKRSLQDLLSKGKQCFKPASRQKCSASNTSIPAETFCIPPKTTYRPLPCSPKTKSSFPILPIGTGSKVSGLFLKMKPSTKKTCSPDCSAWENSEKLQGVVKLSSNDKLTIKIKRETSSTEEIRETREPINIKVKDEDGRTLYERKDYTRGAQCHSMLKDMYRESNINRVTTPVTVMAADKDKKNISSYKSDQSVANLIEINLNLRVTQGDKTTEINIRNEDDENQDKRAEIGKVNPEIFIVKNEEENVTEDVPKNDINIKITVRNFKPKHLKVADKRCNNSFSKKISDKFNTVSTGYSTLAVDENEDHVFSIHRATVNLCSSVDISNIQSKTSNELPSKEYTECEPNLAVSSHSTGHIPTDITEDENIEEKSVSSKKGSHSEKIEEINTNESELPDFNDTDEQDATLLGLVTSNECNVESVISKRTSKEEKKVLLKKVFHKAGKTDKNKESVRELREMLKIILTDSSDNEDVNLTSNKLVKDVTYTSLKPNYFRDTDSMNNYYQLDSNLSSIKDSKTELIYPTEEENSQDSERSSDSDANDITFKGCMCSKVAERLNQADLKIGCCCRVKQQKNEETHCDLRNDLDLLLFNYKTAEYVDVVTQNSKYLCSKVNSLNVSMHSKNNSFEKTIDDLKVVEKIEIIKSPKASSRISKTFSQRKSFVEECEMKKIYQNTALAISDDDQLIIPSRKSTILSTKLKSKKNCDDNENNEGSLQCLETDILQSYAAKKAVLQIYAEKTENGENFVAKLPKFVKESEIVQNYEQIATNSYKSICRQNVFMMSVRRS